MSRRSFAKRKAKKPTVKHSLNAGRPEGAAGEQCLVRPKESRGEKRKHLDERLRLLHQRAMLLERQLRQLDDDRFYRTCIFGSARIKPDNKIYKDVFQLARYLAWEGIDILTGGGPGLMEAANKGAQLGKQEKNSQSLSYGISIELEFEPSPNMHLDVKRHHHKFSSRLDDFMRLSHSIIVTPGGIGTLLELFFSWQLVQVRHIDLRPIVLLDKGFWTGIISWMKEFPTERALISPKDFDCIYMVDTPEEAFEVVSKDHKSFRVKRAKRRESKAV
ncbi:MAG: LOG family protein [Proteobacteria bacterium]|nr:MAG: LOG family protein [Pseudomonadota bacterium]